MQQERLYSFTRGLVECCVMLARSGAFVFDREHNARILCLIS